MVALRQFGAALLAVLVIVQPAAASTRQLSFQELILDPSIRDAMIDSDINFRSGLRLRSDRAYVESLYDNLSETVGNRRDGALMTPAERAEVLLRASLEDDAMNVENVLAGSSEYGGLYLDNEAGGVLTVLLTSSTAVDDLPSFPRPDRVIVRWVDRSLADLQATFATVDAAIDARHPAVDDVHRLELDVAANAVVVGFAAGSPAALEVNRTGYAPAAFRDLLGTDGIEVEVLPSELTPGPRSLQCNTAIPDISLYGGYNFSHTSGTCSNPSLHCTLGFQLDKAGSTVDWALTAGHCLAGIASGAPLYHRTYEFGTRNSWLWDYLDGSDRDFGLIRVPNGQDIGDDVQHMGSRTDVDGTQTSNAQGFHRCFTGMMTWQTECGEILISQLNVNCGYWVDNAIKMDMSLINGDSGGPLYRHISATGTARAVAIESCHGGEGSNIEYMPLVEYLPPSWDVSISTEP